MKKSYDNVLKFWNERAGLGAWAGSRDVIAKHIEMDTLARFISDGQRVLDIGCGNGITAMELARRFAVRITGVDFSPEMVAAAQTLAADQEFRGRVDFMVGEVPGIINVEPADVVYTERMVINLPSWAEQAQAIRDIGQLLAPGGLFLMCENSQTGLDRLNELRERVGLSRIEPPWHNRYLVDDEVAQGDGGVLELERVIDYSSTYYLLSRIVNASLAARDGREPDYDSPINRLALELPAMGNVGQGRLWIWRRTR